MNQFKIPKFLLDLRAGNLSISFESKIAHGSRTAIMEYLRKHTLKNVYGSIIDKSFEYYVENLINSSLKNLISKGELRLNPTTNEFYLQKEFLRTI